MERGREGGREGAPSEHRQGEMCLVIHFSKRLLLTHISFPPPPPSFAICNPLGVQTATGAEIVIEERPASELKTVAGTKIAPDGIEAWNPAFDVTPAALITAIVTDKGLVPRKEGQGSENGGGGAGGGQKKKDCFDVKAFCESASGSTAGTAAAQVRRVGFRRKLSSQSRIIFGGRNPLVR